MVAITTGSLYQVRSRAPAWRCGCGPATGRGATGRWATERGATGGWALGTIRGGIGGGRVARGGLAGPAVAGAAGLDGGETGGESAGEMGGETGCADTGGRCAGCAGAAAALTGAGMGRTGWGVTPRNGVGDGAVAAGWRAAGATIGGETGRAAGGETGRAAGGETGRAGGVDTGRGTPETAPPRPTAAPMHRAPSTTTVSGWSRVVGATPSSVWIRWA